MLSVSDAPLSLWRSDRKYCLIADVRLLLSASSVDDLQISCYRIMCSIYSLGTVKTPHAEKWVVTASQRKTKNNNRKKSVAFIDCLCLPWCAGSGQLWVSAWPTWQLPCPWPSLSQSWMSSTCFLFIRLRLPERDPVSFHKSLSFSPCLFPHCAFSYEAYSAFRMFSWFLHLLLFLSSLFSLSSGSSQPSGGAVPWHPRAGGSDERYPWPRRVWSSLHRNAPCDWNYLTHAMQLPPALVGEGFWEFPGAGRSALYIRHLRAA